MPFAVLATIGTCVLISREATSCTDANQVKTEVKSIAPKS